MDTFVSLCDSVVLNWPTWVVTVTLIVAASIDGVQLRVPNWLTFPMIISGWAYSITVLGWDGFWGSLAGTIVGIGLLLPAYAIGGMGAGDVKLLAGVGAWVHATHTLYAFFLSAAFGAIIAVGMVVYRRAWARHVNQLMMILSEILTIRDPNKLASIASERKSSMLLLPYGIPIAIGTITYFVWEGMLL